MELTSSRVRPPKQRIEHLPPPIIKVVFRVTAVQMPHAPANIEAPGPVAARIVHVGAEQMVERVRLEVPDCAREEARADQEDEVRHYD